MTRLEKYKTRLAQCREEFVTVCKRVVSTPVPSESDYAGLYFQDDDESLIPVSLVWISHPGGYEIDSSYPFRTLSELEWHWASSDLDEGIHEEAEEVLFEWISSCWLEAGGEKFEPLFVLYDHGSMDTYDLRTLDLLSDRDIEELLA